MNSKDTFDDDIDLRQIVALLLRYKWVIVATTVILAVGGYLFTKLLLPKQYEATALVIVTKPIFTTNLDARIQAVYQQPDAKSLTALALADDIVLAIYQKPEVQALFDEPVELQAIKARLQVSLVGTTQLTLKVTDTDPRRAASLANAWAEIVATRLNGLYDINQSSLEQIQAQMETARQNWDTAEQAVISKLAAGQVDSLSVTLNHKRESFKVYLDEIRALDLLIGDIQALDDYLAPQRQADALSLDSELALIGLQQRAAGGLEGLQVQLAAVNAFETRATVAAGRAKLRALAAALQSQRLDLQEKAADLAQELAPLSAELEAEQYAVTQLTVQRDLALSAYQALASQTIEAQITLAQNDRVVKIAGQALPPEQPSGPSGILNGILAGAAGLILSVCAVLVAHWWKISAPAAQV